MTAFSQTHPTLIGALWPAQGTALARRIALMVVGTLLLWASAKIQVPFYPVPMTMQTFVVLVLGAAYGWRLGGATMLLYLAEGAVGLPVFAGTPERGIGLPYMLGPTGGYLVGFVLAAMLVGWLAERGWDRTMLRTFLAMAAGHAAILVSGVLWLAAMLPADPAASPLAKAIAVGLTPFWYATALKTLLAAIALPLGWRLIGAGPAGR